MASLRLLSRVHRLVLILAAASLLAMSSASAVAAPVDPEYRPQLTGFASPEFRTDVPAYLQDIGKAPGIYQLYWDLADGWPNAWAAGILNELEVLGVGVAYAEITTTDLDALLEPGPNPQLDALVASVSSWLLASPDRHLLVAPLPEANLPGHPYGGDAAAYKAGYLKIRSAFRDGGLGSDKVRFVFAMNGLSGPGLSYPMFYPGDAVVDVVAFSKVNRGNPWRDFQTTFDMHIVEMSQLTSSKPILISQTASVDIGGERAGWLDDMFGLLPGYPQVIGAIYYDGSPSLGFEVVAPGAVDPTFAAGSKSWASSGDVAWLFDGRMDAWVSQRELADPPPRFRDTAGSQFADDIDWLAEQGITAGCNPPVNDRFCPSAYVTRGQMAAFLVRGLGLSVGAGSDVFRDEDGSTFEAEIERLAAAGITAGCNPPVNDRFCPSAYVTRGQMAAFLHRGLAG